MIPFERCETILRAVREYRYISINKLMDITDSSLTTLRRDINFLAGKGKIEKIRGGIVSVEKSESENIFYLYRNREKLFAGEKRTIGAATQKYIEENDIILLTYGTTTAQVARHIDPSKHLTVITNGIDIVSILKDRPNVEVILLGGKVDYSYNVVKGPSLMKMLDDLHPSKVIMGAGGITEQRGITGYDFLNSTFLKGVIERVNSCFIVADHSKFDRNVLVHIAPLEAVDVVITDDKVPSRYVDIFDRFHIEHCIAHD
jgi:DeoR/GlpR family transcriptional regulator of sugar metabolism